MITILWRDSPTSDMSRDDEYWDTEKLLGSVEKFLSTVLAP